jgi:hypothetical protein
MRTSIKSQLCLQNVVIDAIFLVDDVIYYSQNLGASGSHPNYSIANTLPTIRNVLDAHAALILVRGRHELLHDLIA